MTRPSLLRLIVPARNSETLVFLFLRRAVSPRGITEPRRAISRLNNREEKKSSPDPFSITAKDQELRRGAGVRGKGKKEGKGNEERVYIWLHTIANLNNVFRHCEHIRDIPHDAAGVYLYMNILRIFYRKHSPSNSLESYVNPYIL